MKHYALIFCGLFWAFVCQAKEMVVGLYEDVEVKKVQLAPKEGSFELRHQNKVLVKLNLDSEHQIVYLTYFNNQVQVNYGGEDLGLYRDLIMVPDRPYSSFKVKVGDDERQYAGSLDVRILRGAIKLVNRVDLEEYVAGVLESEVGHYNRLEFLKAQSIIVRTYALRNISKHINLGYEVCDTDHCQVYRSKAYGKNAYEVYKAVYATQNQVLMQSNGRLVDAVYHSNCGGQTESARDVWRGKDIEYLQSKREKYCDLSAHARWYFKVPKAEFFAYLGNRNGKFKGDYSLMLKLNQFEQRSRKRVLEVGDVDIPLTEVREKFDLPSTFFSYRVVGEEVIFEGRGFGHGVGLCQEGAAARALAGFNYREILNFYYTAVVIGLYAQ